MLKRSLPFALLALMMAATSCGPSADELKADPNKDAAYKRDHRAEGYRKAQNSQPQPAVQ